MMSNNLRIIAAGWDLGGACGGSPGREFAGRPPWGEIFGGEFRNFGRLDEMARAVAVAAALALRGAGRLRDGATATAPPAPKPKLPVSMLWAHPEGARSADLAYYRDYLAFGGEAGRANLFIQTLPSSPLAEGSVHFGLTGSLAYLWPDDGRPWRAMLEAATDACEFRDERAFLLGVGERRDGAPRCLMVYLEAEGSSGNRGVDARRLLDLDGLAPTAAAGMIKSVISNQ